MLVLVVKAGLSEGAVEAAGQVEILKWAFRRSWPVPPRPYGLRPNGSLTVAGFGNQSDIDRLQFACTHIVTVQT